VNVSEVPVKAVMMPSMKFVGVVVYATRIRVPTVKEVAVEARLVVRVEAPRPIASEVVDVRLLYPIPENPL
jgi:hypothetical protein